MNGAVGLPEGSFDHGVGPRVSVGDGPDRQSLFEVPPPRYVFGCLEAPKLSD